MPANKESDRDPGASLALLWGAADDRPRRGPKRKFTPAQVARRGIEIADAEGLEALSMQRVAELLGVTTMALYRYVPGKPDLIDLMVDTVLSDPPDLTRVRGGWRPRLEAWARACWDVYRAHPWILTATGLRRHAMGPHQVAWLDTVLASLEETGLTARQRHDAAILVLSLVRNLTQEALDRDEQGDREWDRLTTDQLTAHADRYPALTRAIAEGAFAPTGDDPLAFGLTCVLNGIQGLVASSAYLGAGQP
ncbi:TetR/AcrR family transcriptional regulator [Streptomyces sp. NBC_00452]|uniref:TetR/AcrR family transcriptional regulator n=1 Tax=Streptomyces sp. NBC_00452 TaxID=2975746 RepID=UPI002251EED1|nr:TetR/AcrR family transcriptional regulator C-terminal domain-containing protein [Streptomyces sp. NBC_00452]MCX5063622.1 TetR/AcrR family transcriptional regulator [Streptomyces sp. NBC_00452]